jgi:hypothetical protein
LSDSSRALPDSSWLFLISRSSIRATPVGTEIPYTPRLDRDGD